MACVDFLTLLDSAVVAVEIISRIQLEVHEVIKALTELYLNLFHSISAASTSTTSCLSLFLPSFFHSFPFITFSSLSLQDIYRRATCKPCCKRWFLFWQFDVRFFVPPTGTSGEIYLWNTHQRNLHSTLAAKDVAYPSSFTLGFFIPPMGTCGEISFNKNNYHTHVHC